MFSQVILVFVHREIFGKNSDCDMDCLAGRGNHLEGRVSSSNKYETE